MRVPRSALRLLRTLPVALLILPSAIAQPAGGGASAPPSTAQTEQNASPLLPQAFAGWVLSGVPKISTSPDVADAGSAAALEEYGFSRYEAAAYTCDGEALRIKAIQFGDATGAYGAFTFYRRPNMAAEPIGQGGAFDGTRVLFWAGTVLVDATFGRITPMSAAELRELARELPQPLGNQGTLPTLPRYLPPEHQLAGTVRYAIGPVAYAQSGGVLPPAMIGFAQSAEVVTADYNALNGTGTLTIVNYPTPEIAKAHEQALRQYLERKSAGWTPALTASNPEALRSRRSGPLLALTSGSFSAGSAEELLERMHYAVNLTRNRQGRAVADTTRVAQIILGVAMLVGIFALIAIVAGVSLGGGRVLWRRMRRKPGSEEEEKAAEFIRLNLRD